MKLHPGLKSKQPTKWLKHHSIAPTAILYSILFQNTLSCWLNTLKNYQLPSGRDNCPRNGWVKYGRQVYITNYVLLCYRRHTGPPFPEIVIWDIKLRIMKQSFKVKYSEYNPLAFKVDGMTVKTNK